MEHIRAVDMCEVFSLPRVSKEAIKHGLEVGDAMDLTTGCDFNLESHRRKAEAYVEEQEPLVLIGSPPCVAFSQLEALIPDSQRKARQLAEGIRHMDSWPSCMISRSMQVGCSFMNSRRMRDRGPSPVFERSSVNLGLR